MLTLAIHREQFKVRGAFTIARGSRTVAEVLTVHLRDGLKALSGYGECVPYARYGETLESVEEQITSAAPKVEAGADREELLSLLPAGAARNAIDAALWDLALKRHPLGTPSCPWPSEMGPGKAARSVRSVRTVRTLSLGSPDVMANEASKVAHLFATLKLKLGGEEGPQDLERVGAVRKAAPNANLIVDANESWPAEQAQTKVNELTQFGVSLIEQPVAVADDQVLGTFPHAIPLCADESFHCAKDLARVAPLYEVVNLKLDKTGGLTHALVAKKKAEAMNLGIMVGCMLGTSLAMAPALLLAQGVDLVDLDGPYLLAEDRDHPLELSEDGWIGPNPACWG